VQPAAPGCRVSGHTAGADCQPELIHTFQLWFGRAEVVAALLQRSDRMKRKRLNSSRPLLNWLLRRGPHTLAFQVRRAGSRYQVLVLGGGERVYSTLLGAGRDALQLHAACVNAFREAGWTSVAYR
jgi:hypothetical protein